jgi:hypothetical protein
MMNLIEKIRHSSRIGLAVGSLLMLVWGALFVGGLIHYSGSALVYALFSFVFLAMLLSGLFMQAGYGYLFLVVMLWLGFWLKVTVHLWLDYPYRESIGLFDGSGASWDQVLFIASMGALGVIAARLLFRWMNWGGDTSAIAAMTVKQMPILEWYAKWRRFLWCGLILSCAAVAIINAMLGIMQVGLAPRTILPWPSNALIAWLLGTGFSLGVATLLWWDVLLGRGISIARYGVLLEAFLSTVTMLSRGAYVFHAVPQIFALLKNKKVVTAGSMKGWILFVIAFFGLFLVSAPLVNTLRAHHYSNAPLMEGGGGLNALTGLLVDRWVGAEGLMVVEAYPAKDMKLLWRGLQERRQIGSDTMYVEMSRPKYYGMVDKEKYQFTEIPGAMAFLFYSGQVWIVVAGMILLTGIVLGSEILVLRVSFNPILCALWGGVAANMVAQMGVAPLSSLIPILETVVAVLLIGYIQSAHFSSMARRIGAYAR